MYDNKESKINIRDCTEENLVSVDTSLEICLRDPKYSLKFISLCQEVIKFVLQFRNFQSNISPTLVLHAVPTQSSLNLS